MNDTIERECRFQVVFDVARMVGVQGALNAMWADVLDTLRAQAMTKQVAPFHPISFWGWVP